ncbi:hypothetical protein TAMA11512_12370 [Selenomonas sp. TAMA-11512]|uniref:DNA translocase FtsK n=1 Tax=Selenomonas sp. TAMA-11512 TaxID=3095337 RepID=UPI0030917A63|nr:hypothetical protein TAMA11512_12370 [Selenomonas sp. TAMA-11512]
MDKGKKYELFGLLLVAVGLIGLCGMLDFNVGFIGLTFAKILHYFFGYGAWLAVALLLGGGVRGLFKHAFVSFTPRFWIIGFLMVSLLAILHHFVAPPDQEILPEVLPDGGGLLGGMVLFLVRKLFGLDGGIIVLSLVAVALILLSTNWSIAIGYLTTKRHAKKGIVKTKGVLEAVGQKAVILDEIVIEPLRDKLKNSFYNQDADKSFQEEPLFKRSDYDRVATSPTPEEKMALQESAESSVAVISTETSAAGESSMADLIIANRALVSQYRPQPDFSFSTRDKDGLTSVTDTAKNTALSASEGEDLSMTQTVSPKAAGTEDTIEKTSDVSDEVESPDRTQDISIDSSLIYDFDADVLAKDVLEEDTSASFTIDYGKRERGSTEDHSEDAPITEEVSDKRLQRMYGGADVSAVTAGTGLASAGTAITAAASANGLSMSMMGQGLKMNSLGEVVSENRAASGSIQEESVLEPLVNKPYELPSVAAILKKPVKRQNEQIAQEIAEKAKVLSRTLEDFKVKARIINACRGPAVTRYELEPAPGVKVSKITNLAEDIALSLAATAVRIEPIPGKAAIGIEVPNAELSGVRIREVLETGKFLEAESKLTVGLGIDIGGEIILADIGKMPHLLVAGSTGSGKSVCINTLITSILFKAKPDEVKFILIDPKMVELSNYNGIPHLMVPVVTDAKKAAAVLNWSVLEMEKRYTRFANEGVRDMARFNALHPEDKMPAVIIIIDELADLMMVAPHDVEDAIARLTAKARAAGIHLILATQRPSVDVITGTIKNNIPSRIAFAVSSLVDSRTILDAGGAEKLLGKGDMLFSPIGSNKATRVQGAFISDEEVEDLLDFIRGQGQPMEENEEIIAYAENAVAEDDVDESSDTDEEKVDELLGKALEIILNSQQASTSNVQRRLRIGYTRAARIIDTLEEMHIIGPAVGSKPREILMMADEAMAIVEGKLNS